MLTFLGNISLKHIPVTQGSISDSVNFPALFKKLQQLNENLTNPVKLSESEITHLTMVESLVKEKAEVPAQVLKVIERMFVEWPREQIFPGMVPWLGLEILHDVGSQLIIFRIGSVEDDIVDSDKCQDLVKWTVCWFSEHMDQRAKIFNSGSRSNRSGRDEIFFECHV